MYIVVEGRRRSYRRGWTVPQFFRITRYGWILRSSLIARCMAEPTRIAAEVPLEWVTTTSAWFSEHGTKRNSALGAGRGEGEGENESGGVEELDERETRRLPVPLVKEDGRHNVGNSWKEEKTLVRLADTTGWYNEWHYLAQLRLERYKGLTLTGSWLENGIRK